MAMNLISLAESLVQIRTAEKKFDTDAIDRFRYRYTNMFLFGASTFIFSHSYMGQSVQCWCDKQIKDSWEEYIETYCLVENTFYVAMNESNIPHISSRESIELIYYQWVPFILALLGFFLYVPRMMWQFWQNARDIRLCKITLDMRRMAKKHATLPDSFSESIQKESKKFGAQLAYGILFVKFIAILGLIGELYVLSKVLGPQYYFWGYGVLADMLSGVQWQSSGHFPRVTFCDVQVREMGNVVHNWTFQCVLTGNMFNEKIFIAVWWWFVLLLVLSVLNFLLWCWRVLYRRHNTKFIASILNDDDPDVDYFVADVLKKDGCVIAHLISDNASFFSASEYVKPLWQAYKAKKTVLSS